jgi:hypothetical protein
MKQKKESKKKINMKEISDYVQQNIAEFHENRLKRLENTNLRSLLLKKNPYLFKAKNVMTAQELVTALLDAKLSASEEEVFGAFLEDLALFIAQRTLGAAKSSSDGIDFEYSKGGKKVLVSVKSGLNWGNSSQWKALESDFKKAQRVLLQSKHVAEVKCVLGVSYGKAKTTLKRGIIWQVCGQNFWYMITGSESFYKEIMEPLGHRAKELNDSFNKGKARLINRLTKDFLNEFCDDSGIILWDKVVEYNSHNITEEDKRRF